MGKEFEVIFRLGTLIEDGRVRLSDFQVARRLTAGGPGRSSDHPEPVAGSE